MGPPQPLVLNKQPILKKIFTNIGWLLFDKLLRMGVGLLVVIWLARYFGPEQFGQLNYLISFVALLVPFSALGLNALVTRELVTFSKPSETRIPDRSKIGGACTLAFL